MNCAENAPEDTEFMMKSFYSEGDTSIVDYLQQYNIDLNKSMIEFGTYDYALCGRGLDIQLSGQTSLKGFMPPAMCWAMCAVILPARQCSG